MTYGVDYDFSITFYTVVFAIVMALGIYALINPDFFRQKDRKGQPRSLRDIILGIWLIVSGALLVFGASSSVFTSLLYKSRFSEKELANIERLFCDTVKPAISKDTPKISTLPAPPYLLVPCIAKNPEVTGADCSVECTRIYRSQALPAESAEKANAYIFVDMQRTETGPVGGFAARIVVYDKSSNHVFLWFDTQANQGTYVRVIRPDAVQRILNQVAERIADSHKGDRS